MDQNGPRLGKNYYHILIIYNKIHVISIFRSFPKILPILEKIHAGKDNIVPPPYFEMFGFSGSYLGKLPKNGPKAVLKYPRVFLGTLGDPVG